MEDSVDRLDKALDHPRGEIYGPMYDARNALADLKRARDGEWRKGDI